MCWIFSERRVVAELSFFGVIFPRFFEQRKKTPLWKSKPIEFFRELTLFETWNVDELILREERICQIVSQRKKFSNPSCERLHFFLGPFSFFLSCPPFWKHPCHDKIGTNSMQFVQLLGSLSTFHVTWCSMVPVHCFAHQHYDWTSGVYVIVWECKGYIYIVYIYIFQWNKTRWVSSVGDYPLANLEWTSRWRNSNHPCVANNCASPSKTTCFPRNTFCTNHDSDSRKEHCEASPTQIELWGVGTKKSLGLCKPPVVSVVTATCLVAYV